LKASELFVKFRLLIKKFGANIKAIKLVYQIDREIIFSFILIGVGAIEGLFIHPSLRL